MQKNRTQLTKQDFANKHREGVKEIVSGAYKDTLRREPKVNERSIGTIRETLLSKRRSFQEGKYGNSKGLVQEAPKSFWGRVEKFDRRTKQCEPQSGGPNLKKQPYDEKKRKDRINASDARNEFPGSTFRSKAEPCRAQPISRHS